MCVCVWPAGCSILNIRRGADCALTNASLLLKRPRNSNQTTRGSCGFGVSLDKSCLGVEQYCNEVSMFHAFCT